MKLNIARLALYCTVIASSFAVPVACAQEVSPETTPILSVSGGGQFHGAATQPSAAGRVAWKTPSFSSSFEFPLDSVSAIKFPRKAAEAAREGDLSWEFVSGDVIVGTLISLTDAQIKIDALGLGELELPRGALSAVYRTKAGSSGSFDGPGELSQWKSPPKSDAWQEEQSGAISSKVKYARLWRALEIPEVAKIELELVWRQKGAFSFEITKEPANVLPRNRQAVVSITRPASYRIEVGGNQLVAARESADAGDIAPLQEIALGEGRVHLLLYIDQNKGLMNVCKPSGELIAKVETASAAKEHLKLVRFAAGDGDLRIETLRVTPWSGIQPATGNAETATFTIPGADEMVGKIEGFDREKGEWTLRVGEQTRTIKESEISEIRFSPSQPAIDAKAKLVFRSGMLLQGDLVRIEPDSITLKSLLMNREFTLPSTGLFALYQKNAPPKTEPENETEPHQRPGRMEATGIVTKGLLVNHAKPDGGTQVGWKPLNALNDAAIDAKFSGKIVYKELPPPPPTIPEQALQRAPAVRVRSSTGAATIGQLKNNGSTKPMIYLRTGDMVQAEVTKIDENGVEFRSPETKSTFIAHKQLRAVVLASNVAPIGIPKAKKDRLLMLPRSQRESPPTHLVRSMKGDYLRCRIVGMDEENLDVEVRLEAKRIPRNTIARIIWLHPEEVTPPKTNEEQRAADAAEKTAESEKIAAAKAGELLFQSIPEDRKRLTFVPERIAAQLLVGKSPILGECNVDLQSTSVLLIGDAIENSGIPLAYEQWKLRPAPEPLAASETPGDDSGTEGMESVLVGKAAPEIELSMLDGSKFSLAKHKNKVVVLDFWASWCGPCIQAMPQIHKVAEEFRADGVELVGINLEETPDRITATLKRLDLDLAVALDKDGRIAGRYGASSIPQTVIIDKEGKVARVFVGGGPKLGDQIRQALQAATGKTPLKENAPAENAPAKTPSTDTAQ